MLGLQKVPYTDFADHVYDLWPGGILSPWSSNVSGSRHSSLSVFVDRAEP
jgi:hypothetical protein